MVSMIQGVRIRRGKARLRPATAGGIALVFILGCGDNDGLGRRYTVDGHVCYRPQPPEAGSITFYPIDTAGTARDATGTIQNGYYALSTIGGNDGAFPGSYRVVIVAKSAVPSKLQPIVE